MGIVEKIETFVNEAKEMSLKKVEKKIKDGYWEAEQDLKVGKHATLRDTKTNRKIVVYITEDLDEGFKVTTGLQGALSINGKSIAKTQKVGNNVFVMIDKEDGDKTRIPVPNGKNMMTSEIAEWLEDYLKKNPKALTESSYEKDLDQLDELSKKTILNYLLKAHSTVDDLKTGKKSSDSETDFFKRQSKKYPNDKETAKNASNAAQNNKNITNKLKARQHGIKNASDRLTKEDLDESKALLDEINEAEDRYKFLSDLILDFEKKLMLFAPLYKELDSEVVKDIKSLEKECERVRKGRLYKIR